MKECPKCGRPVIEGVVVCDCGHVLKAVFGTEPDRGDGPDSASPGESPRVMRGEPARVSRPPIPKVARKPAGNHWETWLIILVMIGAFRYLMNWRSDQPLIESTSQTPFSLKGRPPAADFSLSSTNERARPLEWGSREILRRHLTQEEYGFMVEMSGKQDRDGVTREELNRARALMKKIESETTAEERAKLTELRGLMTRLAGLTR